MNFQKSNNLLEESRFAQGNRRVVTKIGHVEPSVGGRREHPHYLFLPLVYGRAGCAALAALWQPYTSWHSSIYLHRRLLRLTNSSFS